MEDFLKENWLAMFAVAAQGVWGWLLWSLEKRYTTTERHAACQKRNGQRLEEVEDSTTTLTHRLHILEREVKNLPTVQGIHALSVELEKVRGELSGFRSELAGQRDFMKRTEHQLGLLIEHNMNRGSS